MKTPLLLGALSGLLSFGALGILLFAWGIGKGRKQQRLEEQKIIYQNLVTLDEEGLRDRARLYPYLAGRYYVLQRELNTHGVSGFPHAHPTADELGHILISKGP